MDVDELYDRIVDEFYEDSSIAEIARKLNTTRVRVQRVLITEGLWASRRTREIARLRKEGKSVAEIAELLGKDEKTIQTFLPYSRGQYGREESEDAARSKGYRERMKSAASRMHQRQELAPAARGTGTLAEEVVPEVASREDGASGAEDGGSEKVYRLHLKLVGNPLFRSRSWGELGLEPRAEAELLRLAKAEREISREVLVPGRMTLHAMHYMLQVLFGWQNSHLHQFSLPEEDFYGLTDDCVEGWRQLCGYILRFPGGDCEDECWDDDYEEGKSVKSWFKRKYTRFGPTKALCDNWFYSMAKAPSAGGTTLKGTRGTSAALGACPVEGSRPLKEFGAEFETPLNRLMESLRVEEIFTLERFDSFAWYDWLEEQVAEGQRRFAEADREEMENVFEELLAWRKSLAALDYYYYSGDEERIRQETGEEPKAVMNLHKRMIKLWERRLGRFAWRPEVKPFTEELLYNYDFGDNWHIKITCTGVYDQKEMPAVDKPCCLRMEGLNLVEDVGGISGYLDFLRTINGPDQEEAESTLRWARGLGWTGRQSRPEKAL